MPPPIRTTIRTATLTLPALLTTSLLLPACGASGPADEAVARDSAGIRIVENPAPAGIWNLEPGPLRGATILLESTPSVSIGSLDGLPEYTFQNVSRAVKLEDGRIVVADGLELKYYDADGRHLTTAGGEGEGPGEFSMLNEVVVCEGEVVAGDMGQQYLSVFDRDGTFLRTHRLPVSGSVFPMFLEGCDQATGLPLLRVPSTYSPGDPSGHRDALIAILRADTAATGSDTVAVVPTRVRSGGMIGPFDSGTRYGYDGTNVHVLETEKLEVRTFGSDGSLVRIARVPHEPRPVSDEDHRRAIEASLDAMNPAFAERLRPRLAAGPKPDYMPAASDFVADRTGRLWIQPFRPPFDEPPTRWLVLDARGSFLAAADLPPGFRPLDIGEDWVLGVWEDEMDVPYIRLYRFSVDDA